MKKDNLRMPFEVKRIRRKPGQSAGEHWRALADNGAEDCLLYLITGMVFLMLSVFQYFGTKSPIWFGVAMFASGVALAVWKVRRVRREIETWRLGENGEQYVGQILEAEMRPLGYDVFHDIQIEKCGRKMNIDHVLVGSNGVYLVETKTWRKPERGAPEIEYRKGVLYRAGQKVDDKPIREVRGLAKEASQLFYDLTGRKYFVKPILVFAGWYHRVNLTQDSPILFLNEKRISSFLPKHSPKYIPTAEDIALLRAKLATLE